MNLHRTVNCGTFFHGSLPEIPVILCTGFSEKINKDRAGDVPIEGFLMKPIDLARMAGKVREVLDEKKRSIP